MTRILTRYTRFGRDRNALLIPTVALACAFAFDVVGEARKLPERAVPAIVVRTYDAADTATEFQQSALLVASAILDRAGVSVRWIRCDPNAFTAECRNPLGAYELAVRLIKLRERPSKSTLPLGEANLDVVRRTGSLATVYVNRVRWFADASSVDFATVLGRAIAHEIGHLLIGTTMHPSTGLMRAVWTPKDVAGEDWVFAEGDALALGQACRLRAGLARSTW
jgi:hypothetical protein